MMPSLFTINDYPIGQIVYHESTSSIDFYKVFHVRDEIIGFNWFLKWKKSERRLIIFDPPIPEQIHIDVVNSYGPTFSSFITEEELTEFLLTL